MGLKIKINGQDIIVTYDCSFYKLSEKKAELDCDTSKIQLIPMWKKFIY